jgi:glycosyltransferase involved in cell wall biosynthesis
MEMMIGSKMKILFLSAWFPYPPNNGSKLRIYNLLRGLAQQHQVSLISFTGLEQDQESLNHAKQELLKICSEVSIVPAREYHAKSGKALLGLLSRKPRVLVDRHVPEMAERIRCELDKDRYDLVVASQWYTAAYLEDLPGNRPPAIFEEVEVGVFGDKIHQASSPLNRLRHEMTVWKMQAYFRSLLARFGACTVVSEKEKGLLRQMIPGYQQVEVIPNGVSLADYQDVREEIQPDRLIFAGSFNFSPNYQAMFWFMGEVYPIIRAEIPSLKVMITGDHGGRTVPNQEGVEFTGFVRDIRPLVASSYASLAPLLSGGGTRLKILEAMALRSPVIATTKGAEGLDAVSDEHLLVADTPADFARATLRLLKDSHLRQRLVENAYRFVQERYDWPVIMPRFLQLAEQVAWHEKVLSKNG